MKILYFPFAVCWITQVQTLQAFTNCNRINKIFSLGADAPARNSTNINRISPIFSFMAQGLCTFAHVLYCLIELTFFLTVHMFGSTSVGLQGRLRRLPEIGSSCSLLVTVPRPCGCQEQYKFKFSECFWASDLAKNKLWTPSEGRANWSVWGCGDQVMKKCFFNPFKEEVGFRSFGPINHQMTCGYSTTRRWGLCYCVPC